MNEEESRRFKVQHRHQLIDDRKYARWDPPRFLAKLNIGQGISVLDLGCGPGFWTFPLAEITGPSGTVWALDGSREMLDSLLARSPSPQIKTLMSEMPPIALPDDAVDLIWASSVFHEVTPVENLAAETRRVLRPGGTLAVLDWRDDGASSSGPPRHHRLASRTIAGILRDANYQDVQEIWHDDDNYLIIAM